MAAKKWKISGHRKKAAIWRLDESEIGCHTNRLQEVPARMSCDDVLESVGEQVLKDTRTSPTTEDSRQATAASARWVRGLTGKPSWTWREPRAPKFSTTTMTRMNMLRPPSVPSWPTNCTREATGEAGSPFSRDERRGKRRSPAEWAIRHCPLERSSDLILRAASSATGRAPPSNTISRRARSTRPTRRVQEGTRDEKAYVSQNLGI